MDPWSQPLVLLIIACEVGFWVLVLGGLATRYLLRRRRASVVLLLLVPVLDLVLISASLLDVARGNPPRWAHGLAALYLGFTVVFGPSVIRWADRSFARRFGDTSVPPPPPRHAAAEWWDWGKLLLVWAMTLGVLFVTARIAGTPVPPLQAWFDDPLWSWGARLLPVVVIWFVGWPLWATLFPARPATTPGAGRSAPVSPRSRRAPRPGTPPHPPRWPAR